MICKKCGANLPDGVKFCTECGAKIEVEEITAPQNDAPMNDQVQQAPQNMTEQSVPNNQAGPQGYPNQPGYGPQGGYNQPNYGQMSGYNNPPTPPYGPGGMNQGNYGYGAMPPKKKSSALPLILILVAAAVAAALIVFFVLRNRNGGNPDPNNRNSGSSNVSSSYSSQNSGRSSSSAGKSSSSASKSDQNSSSRSSSSARASSSQGKTSSASSENPTQNPGNRNYTLPQGAKIVKNATLKDLEGEYEGEWTFSVYEADASMYGYDQEEFDKALEMFRSTSHPIELNYYDDGDWGFDVEDWASIWADDFEADEEDGTVLQGSNYIQEVKDGSFSVVMDIMQNVKDDPDYGTGTVKAHVEHSGTLSDKDGKRMITGYFTETIETPKGKGIFAGTFTAEKAKD